MRGFPATDAFLDEDAAALSRDDIRAYIGPNADSYLALWDRQQRDPGRLFWSSCWTASFVPVLWLLYRKQYTMAAALVVGWLAIGYVLPFGAVISTVAGCVFGMYGRSLYLRNAERDAQRIAETYPPGEERRWALLRAGGVSPIAPILGGVVQFAAMVAMFVTPAAADLPACDSRIPQQTALNLFQQRAREHGIDAADARVDGVAETAGDLDEGRSCSATFVTHGRRYGGHYDVTWHGEGHDKVDIHLKVDGRI